MKVLDMARVVSSLEKIGYKVEIDPDWYGREHALRLKRKNSDKGELKTASPLQEEKSMEAV